MEQAELKPTTTKRKINSIGRFCAVVLFTIMFAAGAFLFLAYASYELRLSADVIRAGIVLLYIIPCWAGGRLMRRCRLKHTVLCGAAAAVILYVLVYGMHAAENPAIQLTQTQLINCGLCMLSGGLGAWKR